MSVDRAEVERIAALARLRLGPDEAERLTAEMNRILEHMEALRGLAGAAREADAAPHAALDSVRSSEIGEPDPLGAGPESIAPRWVDGFFVVPAPPGVHRDEGPGAVTPGSGNGGRTRR